MKTRFTAIIALILFTALFTSSVSADFGPKDSLTVYVENPPQGIYYLDLLYENDREQNYSNLTEDELAALNPDMLEAIRNNKFALTAVLTDGTDGIPTFGTLLGSPDGLRMKHTFGYFGLPQSYRIIIVTESGSVHVSEMFTRRSMQSSITYDYRSGTASVPPLWRQYAVQFLYTCLMTLLIEGIILLLFRFSLQKAGITFLAVNLVTQIALTAFFGRAMIQGGTVNSFMTLLACEPFILGTEAAAYAFLLREHSRGRRIGYAVAANLASWGISLLTNGMLYALIVKIA